MADVIEFNPGAARRQDGGIAGASDSSPVKPGGAQTYEHPVPAAGQACDYDYPAKEGSVGVHLVVDDACHMRYEVTAPAADVAAEIEAAKISVARSFGVDNRDLAAMAQLRDALGQEGMDSFVTSYVQRSFFTKATLRTGAPAFLTPDYPDAQVPQAGQDYSFTVNALLHPAATLTSYGPVEFEYPEKPKVGSKDVSQYLDDMADQLATWEPDLTRNDVQEGDHVRLRTRATLDGQELPSLSGNELPYMLGSGVLPEDFDRNVVGMSCGQTKEFSLSIPESLDEAGNPSFVMVQMSVRVLGIDRRVPARIDDAWVIKNAPQAGTLLGLRSQIRSSLEREVEAAYHETLMGLAVDELVKRLDWEIPSEYVERSRDELIQQFALELQQRGVDFAVYASQPEFDHEQFVAQMNDRAVESLRHALALDALADHLGIEATDEEAARTLGQIAPGQDAEMVRAVRQSGQLEQLRLFARRMKANEWLVKNARDTSGPKLQLL